MRLELSASREMTFLCASIHKTIVLLREKTKCIPIHLALV